MVVPSTRVWPRCVQVDTDCGLGLWVIPAGENLTIVKLAVGAWAADTHFGGPQDEGGH